MITADQKHGKYAVREFERISIAEISKCTDVKKIFQFCDNCSGQYKSKGPFQYISLAEIPTVCSYFGACYGKSEADGVIGRLKQGISRDVKSRKATIWNAEEFYVHCCKKNWPIKAEVEKKFFFVKNIDRSDVIQAVRTHNTLNFHQV